MIWTRWCLHRVSMGGQDEDMLSKIGRQSDHVFPIAIADLSWTEAIDHEDGELEIAWCCCQILEMSVEAYTKSLFVGTSFHGPHVPFLRPVTLPSDGECLGLSQGYVLMQGLPSKSWTTQYMAALSPYALMDTLPSWTTAVEDIISHGVGRSEKAIGCKLDKLCTHMRMGPWTIPIGHATGHDSAQVRRVASAVYPQVVTPAETRSATTAERFSSREIGIMIKVIEKARDKDFFCASGLGFATRIVRELNKRNQYHVRDAVAMGKVITRRCPRLRTDWYDDKYRKQSYEYMLSCLNGWETQRENVGA